MGAADYKTVVTRVNTVRQRRLRLVALGALVVVAGGLYYGGYQAGSVDRVPLTRDENGLKAEISRLETRATVDAEALSRLRTELASNERKVNELERELVFYRDIMSSSEDVSSVKVRDPDVLWDPDFRRLEYRAVIQRLAPGTQSYRGTLQVVIIDNEGEVLASAFSVTREHDLGFKYFQRISGIIDIPETFIPAKLRFAIELSAPRKRAYQQVFDWRDAWRREPS